MNRETWLNKITDQFLKDHFNDAGYTIPQNVRMSCSLTSGRGAKNKAIGLCFSDRASEDQTHEIFISPSIADSVRVVDILIHELIHATIGLKEGHGKNFRKCAIALGLTGKMTATISTDQLKEKIKSWVAVMGQYPHAVLNSTDNSGGKKQSTRLIKCQCECGYNIRITRKWLNDTGAPICPACNIQMQ
jgi:hypothetical protein